MKLEAIADAGRARTSSTCACSVPAAFRSRPCSRLRAQVRTSRTDRYHRLRALGTSTMRSRSPCRTCSCPTTERDEAFFHGGVSACSPPVWQVDSSVPHECACKVLLIVPSRSRRSEAGIGGGAPLEERRAARCQASRSARVCANRCPWRHGTGRVRRVVELAGHLTGRQTFFPHQMAFILESPLRSCW